ncbi:hypothetical protein E4659_09655 [Dickeya dianthicola]|uniref:hypothetical protein n=1 Tax=Dickeya dianthicola TaxID=204039 RepID=UPI000AAA94FB|nr:hypothetical protein [Dickeya dianthicola]MCI4002140.1 hypothetical protein [Dickeya dianthicola]MCI4029298.1 hypothetical protein [Dickeya dianthicola]MCI4070525.1 hypothetical protein [Dickeya dianthicola]MCI4116177.1 hypothetical protein [Dickeya dianthicola]MCI4121010.1 hypothetical protein [Dickeya dianthicola]
MKYSKWFFSVAVGSCLLSASIVQADSGVLKPYQPSKTKTYVANTSGYCLAISRKDGQMIGNVHSFELGSDHGRQLPGDHPAKMHVVFVPGNSADTKVQCKNGVTKSSYKSTDNIKFDQTAVFITESEVPR